VEEVVNIPLVHIRKMHILFGGKQIMVYHENMKCIHYLVLILLGLLGISTAFGETCKPTRPDALGPFYKPDAPVRSSVGKGYVLAGVVRSAKDCAAIEGAMIEFWLAGPDGDYGDQYRATLFSDKAGSYRFESHVPPPYFGRPPHIHIQISAKGYQTLVTQHYPAAGKTTAAFDIVLVPEQ
jgi:protocatechuate 3,4-dioxygenase beta subunit